tara:strand:- start:349 stop:699 length:351 start_codon:yes stop_codon:yes gene_type:complete
MLARKKAQSAPKTPPEAPLKTTPLADVTPMRPTPERSRTKAEFSKRPYRKGASCEVDNARVLSSRIAEELHMKLAAKLATLNAMAAERGQQKFSQRELIEIALSSLIATDAREFVE